LHLYPELKRLDYNLAEAKDRTWTTAGQTAKVARVLLNADN
jgi:hypothetical protein